MNTNIFWGKEFVACVREKTTPIERSPLLGELSANFCGWRMMLGQSDGSLRSYS
jgi:hypothetical protein